VRQARRIRLSAKPVSVASRLLGVRTATLTLGVLLSLPAAERVDGQSNAGGRNEVFAGSTFESYLRYLQTLGKSAFYPISIRGFSAPEIDAMSARDSLHPWAARYSFQRQMHSGFQVDAVRPTAGVTFNTAYPFGGNDGVVWTGKGLTSAVQLGVAARWGPFSATLAPVAFRAENQSFELLDNGQTGALAFNDGQFPLLIDKPQRFGNAAYSRVDLGESTLRMDAAGIAAGISTASQWWGPTNDYPFVLGNNSGGFPHVFFGTSKPANAAIVKLHGRIVYGMLYQSDYSPVTGPDYFASFEQPGRHRFMAGIVGVAQVSGAPGLEIGGSRFFHAANPEDGISAHNLALPFQNLLKAHVPNEPDTVFGGTKALRENQLASLFIRWAPPRSGFDVYGEYGREDHNQDLRDFVLEPDHSATMNLGFRKAWMSGNNINAVRAESFTYEISAGTRTRGEGQVYIHGALLQGHTNRGQLLGANTGVGSGSAQTVAYDRFTTGGRITGFLSRVTQREKPGDETTSEITNRLERAVDVMNSIGAEINRFAGSFDITARLVLTSEFNRNFQSDNGNASFGLTVRQSF
jgi:hypothetical protein